MHIVVKKEVIDGRRMMRVLSAQGQYFKLLPEGYIAGQEPSVYQRDNYLVIDNVIGQTIPDSLTGEVDPAGSGDVPMTLFLLLNSVHTPETIVFFLNIARYAANRMYDILDSLRPEIRDSEDEVIEDPSLHERQVPRDAAIDLELSSEPWEGTVRVEF